MIENKGCPDLVDTIVDNLNSWHHDKPFSFSRQYLPLLQDVKQQPTNFLEVLHGRLWPKMARTSTSISSQNKI